MADGFFKSRSHLFNQLKTTLGGRSPEPSLEGQLAVNFPPASELPPTVVGVPTPAHLYDGTEPNTGVRPAVFPTTGSVVPGSALTGSVVPGSAGVEQRPTIPAAARPSGAPASDAPQAPRVSGFQQITVRAVQAPNDAVRAANVEFEDRVGDRIELPMAVLINQRDRALRELAEVHAQSEQTLQAIASDHDRFVAFLMQENAQRVAALEASLHAERERANRAERQAAEVLGSREHSSSEGEHDLAEAQREILELKQALQSVVAAEDISGVLVDAQREAQRFSEAARALELEVEETRTEAVRLQEERDEAIRATDAVRVELANEIQSTQDEVVDLQARCDAAERALADSQDQARDDAASLEEQLAELRRQLDELVL